MRIISGKARGTKLYTLEGDNTRPTLDRVREAVFNIIHSGSGAVGIEFASRGAKKVYMCDNSKKAIDIINKNIEKTHMQEKVELNNCDFKLAISKIKEEKIDIVYLDPPYKTDYIKQALEKLLELKSINEETLIIAETDELEKVLKDLEDLKLKISDQRKYGRANIIFLKRA